MGAMTESWGEGQARDAERGEARAEGRAEVSARLSPLLDDYVKWGAASKVRFLEWATPLVGKDLAVRAASEIFYGRPCT